MTMENCIPSSVGHLISFVFLGLLIKPVTVLSSFQAENLYAFPINYISYSIPVKTSKVDLIKGRHEGAFDIWIFQLCNINAFGYLDPIGTAFTAN